LRELLDRITTLEKRVTTLEKAIAPKSAHRISQEQIDMIKGLNREWYSLRAIAKIAGCSSSSVNRILKEK